MPHAASRLLGLPESMLHEVVGWSPDGATANALLDTCRAVSQVRSDAAVAALLLLRCGCADYSAAVASCGRTCHGGAVAVAQQVLRLGHNTSGTWKAAPEPLLQALLLAAAAAGEAPILRTLLSLPFRSRPDVDAEDGEALLSAVQGGPHMEALRALLDRGADPRTRKYEAVKYAAKAPDRLPALRLILSYFPGSMLRYATDHALDAAIATHNMEALQHLLTGARAAAGVPLRMHLEGAVSCGSAPALQLLLDHPRCVVKDRNRAWAVAMTLGSAACTGLLLSAGVDFAHMGRGRVTRALTRLLGVCPIDDRQATAALLLRHSSVMAAIHAVVDDGGGAENDSLFAQLDAAAAGAT